MKQIGVISDTHNTFDGVLRDFLKDVDEIWHAGDIGSVELYDKIAAFKPVRAVYGNIDGGVMRRVLSEFECFTCEGVDVVITHIGGYPKRYTPNALKRIVQLRPKVFVAGHSHILKVIYDKDFDLLHINPGAAGVDGFHRTRTAVRFKIDGERIYDMEVGEWSR